MTGTASSTVETEFAGPSAAGVWDAFLDGLTHFRVDQRVADALTAAEPNLVWCAREHRHFLRRALTYVRAQGIRQFVDLGCGLATRGNVAELLDRHGRADIRLVCVDIDPVVATHVRLHHHDDPRITAIQADLRRPTQLLSNPTLLDAIDFGEPVAVLLVAVLQHLTDTDDPAALITRLRDAVVAGSHLVVSCPGIQPDRTPELAAAFGAYPTTWAARDSSHAERLLAEWTPIQPGVTAVRAWRPDPDDFDDISPLTRPDDALGWAAVAVAVPTSAPNPVQSQTRANPPRHRGRPVRAGWAQSANDSTGRTNRPGAPRTASVAHGRRAAPQPEIQD